jgi:Predicted rRNA methylase
MNNYVSRAGHKLEEATRFFRVDFRDKVILDIGSSTGGFTDFALKNGAKKVIAIEKGTDQMHPSLLSRPNIELHEKTDIFSFVPAELPDIITIDVSFISLVSVLDYARTKLARDDTTILAMLKPQFEASPNQLVNGKVKNSRIRRTVIHNFEANIKPHFVILGKHDNSLKGKEEGNLERFYLLKTSK